MHLCDRIWSNLQKDPPSHLEYIQWCNLHLAYLGSGIYIQLIPQTETVNFQIFNLPAPVEMDIETKPVAIGTLTSDETETLSQVLISGISAPTRTPASATITKAEYEKEQHHQTVSTNIKAQHPDRGKTTVTATVHEQDLMTSPTTGDEYDDTAQQCSAHDKMAQHISKILDSPDLESTTSVIRTTNVMAQQTENQTTTGNICGDHHDPPTVLEQNSSPKDTITSVAADKLHIDAPDVSDTSISAELVRAILNNWPTIVIEHVVVPPVKSPQKPTPAKTSPCVDLNYIISNQPKVILKKSKEAEKLVQQSCKPKIKKETGIFPTPKTSLKFKFRISKFGIKWRMKRKYAFHCKVVDCTKVCKSLHEWNIHHRMKHPEVKYRCNVCNKYLDIETTYILIKMHDSYVVIVIRDSPVSVT